VTRQRSAASRRARVLAIAAALGAAACGGGTSATPTPPATPSPAPLSAPSVDPVVLTGGNFGALVLGSPSACLVEFQRPT
jgi:ABC-type glycerol-3-phosphate transport system substrate-binding protein